MTAGASGVVPGGSGDAEGEGEGELDAGAFSTWAASLDAALAGTADADVACGTCTACCTSSQFIHIRPDEADALGHIPAALRFPAPGLPKGHVLLGYDEHGRCPMLVDGACSIYDHRPRTCRTYDCRVFAASGIELDDASKHEIRARARRWRFEHPTAADRAEHDAVLAAGAHLSDPTADLPDDARRLDATQRAVLAVEVRHAFAPPEPSDPTSVRTAIDRALSPRAPKEPGSAAS